MNGVSLQQVVIDTNVLFEGITKQGTVSSLIIDSWAAGLIVVCISNAVAFEYEDVLSRKLSEARWRELKPLLKHLLSLAKYTRIHFSWRPTSPDPGDDLAIDCAMNAGAILVTFNVKDFQRAKESLGLPVMTPSEFLNLLASGDRL